MAMIPEPPPSGRQITQPSPTRNAATLSPLPPRGLCVCSLCVSVCVWGGRLLISSFGGSHLAALGEDGAREDGGGGGAIARDVVRLGRHLPHQLRAHVHEPASGTTLDVIITILILILIITTIITAITIRS
jgi:hypothetical protein